MDAHDFKGRTALVTGGSRGIGRAVSLRLAAAGAAVAVNYAGNERAAEETRAAVEAAGAAAMTVRADVADPDAVKAMVGAVEETLGPVDLLVTSAGVADVRPYDRIDIASWRRTMAVNVDGTFSAIQAAAPGMTARGYGRIVCIASIAGLFPRPMMIGYAVSKAAVIAIVRNFAPALAPAIRINAVAPGLTETEMIQAMDAETRAAIVADTPLGRLGRPEEIAELAFFLLSEGSSFSTGQTIVADGGRIMLP